MPWPLLERVHDAALLARIRDGGLSVREQRGLGLPWSPRARRPRAPRRGGHAGGGARCARARGGDEPRRRHPPRRAARSRAATACSTTSWRRSASCAHRAGGARAGDRLRRPPGRRHRRPARARPSRFTVSLHGARNYPFQRVPSDLDIDLPSGTGDADYLEALSGALDVALRRCTPDVAFYLAGADPWEGYRLGRLALTKAGLRERDALALDRLLGAGTRSASCSRAATPTTSATPSTSTPRRRPSWGGRVLHPMEARGIEPLPQPCKGRVLPLSLRPLRVAPQDRCGRRISPWPPNGHGSPRARPRSPTTTSSTTGSTSRRTGWSCATTSARSCAPPTARSRSRSPSCSATGRSTSSAASASSTTVRAARTRAESATTRRSTSTRYARSPR